MRWVRAHLSEADAERQGVSCRDHRGNARADMMAHQCALSMVDPSIVREREIALELLQVCQMTQALVQLAVLTADHTAAAGNGPRVQRTWRRMQRQPRPPIAARQVDVQAPHPPFPAGLHDVERHGDEVACRRCNRRAARSRWHNLLWRPCEATQPVDGQWTIPDLTPPPWQWHRSRHVLVVAAGVCECLRCGGQVAGARAASMRGRWCPAWLAREPAPGGLQESDWDWGALTAKLAGLRVAGQRPARAQRAPLPPAAPPQPVLPEALQVYCGRVFGWRPHVAAHGPGYVACLVCGRHARAWDALAAGPCAGWVVGLPARAQALGFVEDIARAGGPAAAFAAACVQRFGRGDA